MQEADADGRTHARHGRQEHAGRRGPGAGALQSGQTHPAVTLVEHGFSPIVFDVSVTQEHMQVLRELVPTRLSL